MRARLGAFVFSNDPSLPSSREMILYLVITSAGRKSGLVCDRSWFTKQQFTTEKTAFSTNLGLWVSRWDGNLVSRMLIRSLKSPEKLEERLCNCDAGKVKLFLLRQNCCVTPNGFIIFRNCEIKKKKVFSSLL